jgi:hypothetical protein
MNYIWFFKYQQECLQVKTQGYFVDTEGNTFGIFEVYEQAGR